MNIAMLINNYPPAIGGAELYAGGLAERLSKKDNVYVVTRAYKDAADEEAYSPAYCEGCVYIKRTKTTNIFGLRAIIHFIKAFNIIRKSDIDVIHAYHVFSTGFLAVIIGKLLRKPVVIRDGQSVSSVEKYLENRIYKAIIKYTLNRATVYVDNPRLAEIFGSLCGKGIRLIPNPVDTDKFVPKRHNRKKLIVGYIGRLEQFKGVDMLIDCVPLLKGLKFRILIVGDGTEQDQLKTQANAFNKMFKKELVTIEKSIPYDEVHKFYQSIDIFVQPSITYETPNTTLQAMASGLPIIATAYVANHILERWKNAIVINQYSNEIAMSIVALMYDRKLMKRLGDNARKYAERYLDWDKHTQSVLSIYNEALKSEG